MKRKVHLYINDIIENIFLAEKIVRGLDYAAFVADKEKNYAVVRCIEIIGEAVKNIPETIRRRYPEIPWREMAGMRDKVIHFYLGVDYGIVWQTATKDLPEFKNRLKQIAVEIAE
jgi:uncharacterized protein with HEPN domain